MTPIFYTDDKLTVSYDEVIDTLNNSSNFYENYYADDYIDFFYNCITGIITGQKFVLHDFLSVKNENISPVSVKTDIKNLKDLREKIISSQAEIGIFSSGSEGPPKLIFQPVKRLLNSVRISDDYAFSPWGFTYHPAHSAGIQFLIQILCNLSTLVNLRGIKNDELISFIQKTSVQYLAATPTFYRLLSPFDFTVSSVKSLTLNGEKSTEKLIIDLKKCFPNAKIRNIYGSTEAGPLMSSESEIFTVPPRLYDSLKIVDGHLYFHKSILSKSVSFSEWYPSGDLVEVISENPLQIKFVSRISRIINVGGHNVNPQQIEEMILQMPGVQDVRVTARPNPVTENLLIAHIILNYTRDINEKTVITYLKSQSLPAYKIPRIIRFVEEIPTGRTGKKLL